MTDSSDMSLYLIEVKNGSIGYSVDAYGIYSNPENEAGYDNFTRQVPEKKHQDQLLFEI